jgi:hypothetical protein
MSDERSQQAVIVAEAYADRSVGDDILDAAATAAMDAANACRMEPAWKKGDWAKMRQAWYAAQAACFATVRDELDEIQAAAEFTAKDVAKCMGGKSEAPGQLLREIFGNPFRPVALDPSWFTPTVLALANGIYHARDFDRMPILADALQNASCENEDILNHCRQPGEHVRGCWALDLVLGKL